MPQLNFTDPALDVVFSVGFGLREVLPGHDQALLFGIWGSDRDRAHVQVQAAISFPGHCVDMPYEAYIATDGSLRWAALERFMRQWSDQVSLRALFPIGVYLCGTCAGTLRQPFLVAAQLLCVLPRRLAKSGKPVHSYDWQPFPGRALAAGISRDPATRSVLFRIDQGSGC